MLCAWDPGLIIQRSNSGGLKALSHAGRKKWSYRVIFRNLPDEQPQEFSARQLADTYGSIGGLLEGFCLSRTSLTDWPCTWLLTGTEVTAG